MRIPDIAEFASDEWTDWKWNSILIEGANCREIIDNVTDMAHFFYIHFGLPTYFKNVFEGHIASQYLHNVGRPDVNDLGTSYGEAHLRFGGLVLRSVVHDQLAAQQLRRLQGRVDPDQLPLPGQPGLVHAAVGRHRREAQGLSTRRPPRSWRRRSPKASSKGFLQDVEIWKHKTRIDNPLLVEEDGAVYQMRRWYQQFYVDVADVTASGDARRRLSLTTLLQYKAWSVPRMPPRDCACHRR